MTKEPEDAYKARFTYDVPEGKMVKFKTTLHVQLTPANASVNNVVVNLQTSDTRNLNVHALKISDVDISTTFRFVTRSASAWTDQGGGHYTRPLYVTFQTVDDDIVKSRDSLGAISIFTSNIDKQIRRGAGSQVEFIHGEDDLTFPKLGGLSYTSNTTGSYAVVSGRMATAPVVVSVNVSGDVSMVTHARHTVEIPGHSSYGTEVRALRDGHVLTFTCTGTGMGVGELVLTPHWNSTGQMLDNYSHRMKVCPKPPPPPPPPPPSPFVEFSVVRANNIYSIHGHLQHATTERRLMGYVELSGSAAILNYSGGSIAKFIYVEEHEIPGSSIFRDDNGQSRWLNISCGPGSGWARVYYLATADGTTVPYSPFHRFRVC